MEEVTRPSALPDLKALVGESESETDQSPVPPQIMQSPIQTTAGPRLHVVRAADLNFRPKTEVAASNTSSPDNLVIDLPEEYPSHAQEQQLYKPPTCVGDNVVPIAVDHNRPVSSEPSVLGLHILAEAVEERRMQPRVGSSPSAMVQDAANSPVMGNICTTPVPGMPTKVPTSSTAVKHYIVKSTSNPNTDIVLRVQGTEVDITTTSSTPTRSVDMQYGPAIHSLPPLNSPFNSMTPPGMPEEDKASGAVAPEEDLETTVQKFMYRYCEETSENHLPRVKDVPVKDLRHIIPLLIMNIYGSRADSSQKKSKVKGLWWKRPEDWPDCVPFCDPNNSKRTSPDGSASKPKKDTLSQMFDFLLKKYMDIQAMKKESVSTSSFPVHGDYKPDVHGVMNTASARATNHSSLDMLANVAVVNESQQSQYTTGPRPPKIMKVEHTKDSTSTVNSLQGLDLSNLKTRPGLNDKTQVRPLIKTFEVKRNGTITATNNITGTTSGTVNRSSTSPLRPSHDSSPVIRPIVPLTPRGPRIIINQKITKSESFGAIDNSQIVSSALQTTQNSVVRTVSISSMAPSGNSLNTIASSLSSKESLLCSSRPIADSGSAHPSASLPPQLQATPFSRDDNPGMPPMLTSPSSKSSGQENPAVDLTKPKPLPIMSNQSNAEEIRSEDPHVEDSRVLNSWDPVVDVSNRLNSKVNYFDKKLTLPDQQRGLILIVRDTLKKMREVLSTEHGPSVHTFLDAAHSFECTLDVAQVKKHIPEAETARWHNFIAKWYLKIVRQSNEASGENG